MPIKLYVILIGAAYFLYACTQSIDCKPYKNLSGEEIYTQLTKFKKNNLAVEIYNLGECKETKATNAILKFLDDPRVVHHYRFQGMSIQKIANSSLNKITGKSIRLSDKPSESDIKNIINAWKRHLNEIKAN